MAILKGALQGIWRHKLRSILILVLSFSVAAEAFPYLCLETGTQKVMQPVRQAITTEVCVRFDPSGMTKQDATGNRIATPISSSLLTKLTALPHVSGYNYVTYRGSQTEDILKLYSSSKGLEDLSQEIESYQETYNRYCPENPYLFPTAIVDGVLDTSKLGEFVYGKAKLTQGRAITPEDKGKNVVMVPADLAQEMKWKPGDQITLSGSYKNQGTIRATIVGLFTPTNTYGWGWQSSDFLKPDTGHNPSFIGINGMATPPVFYASFGMMDNAFWKDQWRPGDAEVAYYYIDDPRNAAGFITQAQKILPADTYSVGINQYAYNVHVKPVDIVLNNLSQTPKTIVILGSAAIFIICFFSLLRRRRTFSTEVKDAGGRTKLVTRLLLELMPLILAAFLVASFAHLNSLYAIAKTSLDANTVTDSLYHFHEKSDIEIIPGQFRPEYLNPPLDKIGYEVTAKATGEYALLGLGIFAGSGLISAACVFTFRLKKSSAARSEEQLSETAQGSER